MTDPVKIPQEMGPAFDHRVALQVGAADFHDPDRVATGVGVNAIEMVNSHGETDTGANAG